jgi:hypothetical protein
MKVSNPVFDTAVGKSLLSIVSKWRVPQIVSQCVRLDEFWIEAQILTDSARDFETRRRLEIAVSHFLVDEVGERKHLRLSMVSTISAAIENAVSIYG